MTSQKHHTICLHMEWKKNAQYVTKINDLKKIFTV